MKAAVLTDHVTTIELDSPRQPLWGVFIQLGQAAWVYSWIRPPSRSRRWTARRVRELDSGLA